MWTEVHELAAMLRSGQYTWYASLPLPPTQNHRPSTHAGYNMVSCLTLSRRVCVCREDLELDTIDQRLKYAGLFHRRKRTPGRFMMRCVSLSIGRYSLSISL